MKFIHLTDTHLVRPGEILNGLDPAARLAPCIDSINRHHGDAAFCVVTGDLADRGESDAYDHLASEVKRCLLPTHTIIGNHDDREQFYRHFPDTPRDEHGFVQYEVETTIGTLLMLDTVEPRTHGGEYCELRRRWLSDALGRHAGRPVYLFMHHPPFDIHLPCIDRIGMAEKRLFAEAVRPYDNIRHLFFGHAHRPLSGSWMGIPFSSLRGTNHQVKLDFGSERIIYVDEPPEYSIVFVAGDTVVVHTESVALTEQAPR